MENNKAPLLLLFDLDDTLIVTSSLKELRDSRKWAEVYRSFPMTTLPPGTLEFISRWTNDATLGVVTNSPRTYAERLLKYHGVGIPVLSAYHDTRNHKPHPAPILRAIEKTGITIADCIYIGDLAEDAQAGMAAGVATVIISWVGRAAVSAPGPAVCRSWTEVSRAIGKVVSQRSERKTI
jgi:phosphoglycolate phosphatase-like HAD superfamily hydrolase